jgi:hypothetical protein
MSGRMAPAPRPGQRRRGVGALGGLAGPAVLIGAWAVLGTRIRGYSAISDPISRLAAVDAPTRWAMTGAFLAYGAGVGAYAADLRTATSRPAAAVLAANVLGTIGIAATPLDSPLGGSPHAVAAGLTYASLAATPVLASRSLAARGRGAAAGASVAAGVASAALLALSALDEDRTGLWQRSGLTVGHLWLMVTAAAHLRRRSRRS